MNATQQPAAAPLRRAGSMIRKCSKPILWIVNAWAILCLVAFVSGILVLFVGAPRWLPLPWSGFTDFVESADRKVFIDLGFYNRVLCYAADGKFMASYPYPFGNAVDTGLAASTDGRVFFRTQHLLYVYDTDWHEQGMLKGDIHGAANFVLDDSGKPVFVAGRKRDGSVVNRLAKPGDQLFAKQHRRARFECSDGSVLLRQGNTLQRLSKDGALLAMYQAPVVYRPFTFMWPAALAWPYLMIYVLLRERWKRRVIARAGDLELRLLSENDAKHVAAMEPGDLSYAQGEWICPPGKHLSFVMTKARENKEGASVFCGIWKKGQLVGLASLQNIDKHNQTASLHYVVDARHRRQGIATRACGALVDYGFRKAGLNRIQIEVDVANMPSCSVAERLGFAKEGLIRDRYKGQDGFRDCAVYSVLAKDWQSADFVLRCPGARDQR